MSIRRSLPQEGLSDGLTPRLFESYLIDTSYEYRTPVFNSDMV